MFSRTARTALTLLVAALSLFGAPSLAFASWSPPVPRGEVMLGYGVVYGECTHRGVDLRADAGESVSSPVDGTVTFAGTVPADGGGTCAAVTIETADGMRVSLTPLAETSVSEGCAVRAGERLGAVAAGGDSSSSGTHVHLSLRHGDVYLDPSDMLPVYAPPVPEPMPQPTAAAGEAPSAAPPAPIAAATNAPPAVAAVGVPAEAAPLEVDARPEVQPEYNTLTMPGDAREALPLKPYSAPVARQRGLRLPAGIVAPSGVVMALALGVLVAVVAACAAPRQVLERL